MKDNHQEPIHLTTSHLHPRNNHRAVKNRVMRKTFRSDSVYQPLLTLILLSLLCCSELLAGPPDSLTILISGGYRGRINGCQCPSSSKGGLAARATLYKQHFADDELIAFDCGGYLDLDPDVGRKTSLCALLGLRQMNLQAALAGMRDLFYGYDYLRDTADSAGVELISGNFVNSSTGGYLFASWRSWKVNDVSIAVTGLAEHLSGMRIPGAGECKTVPPDSVISFLRQSIPKDARIVILLTDLRESLLRELLPRFPEVDYVFTSSRRIITPSPFYIGSAAVIRPEPDGAAVDGIVVDKFNPKSFRYFSHPISSKTRPDKMTDLWIKKCMRWSN